MNAVGHHSRCPSIVQCYPERFVLRPKGRFSPLSQGGRSTRAVGNPSGGVIRDPAVASATGYIGPGGSKVTENNGRVFVTLKPHGERQTTFFNAGHNGGRRLRSHYGAHDQLSDILLGPGSAFTAPRSFGCHQIPPADDALGIFRSLNELADSNLC